jgi:hypothetical protein
VANPSNIVAEITDSIALQVGNLLPNRKKSPFVWDFAQNSSKANKSVYAVRQGSASNVAGTNKTVTFDQTFEVALSSDFKNKSDSDSSLSDTISAMYQDLQTVWTEIFLRKLNLSRVLLVSGLELTEPLIDNDNNIVNISLRFVVKYRTEI